MKWEYIRADKYCDSVRDGTHDTPKPTESGYRLVTGKHIKNGEIDISNAYYISEKDYNAINNRSLVEQWDVLMSMIGTVGETAVVKEKPNYAIKNIALFKCGGSKLKGYWLYYYLSSPLCQGYMNGSQKGSSQQFLSLNQLRSLPILITEEAYMRNVVNILSAYDDLIENNQKQIKLLEEAAQRLYKEWFVDLRFPGYETTPILDGIPQGWKKLSAESFFNITIGKTPPRAESQWFTNMYEGIPWISISDMGESSTFIFETSEGLTNKAVEKYKIKIIPAGTILLSFKLTVGRVSIATTNMCTNEAIAHFRLSNEQQREYVYCYLKNYHYDSLGSTSSISKAVNSKIIKAMPFVLPGDDLIEKFSKITAPLFNQIFIKQKAILELKEARDRLLPKLMSGEIQMK